MHGFIAILKNDLRIVIKDTKTLILLFFMPLAVIQIFALALAPMLENNSFVDPFKIAIVDKDKSPWTGLLATQLKSLGIIEEVIFADEEEARRLIENQEAASAIVLPEDLTDSIDRWEPQTGKVIGSDLYYLQSRLVKNIAFVGSTAVSAGLASLNVIYDVERQAGYTEDELYKELNNANQQYINLILARKELVSEGKLERPDVSPVVYYALSLLAVFILFSSIPCMKLLTEERRLGILSRLNAAPAKSWQTVFSKLLVSFAISSVQFAIIIGFVFFAAGNQLAPSLGRMIPVFLATTMAAGAFALLIASVSDSGSTADLLANLTILLMAVAGGSLYPLSSLPELTRMFSVITINRWAAEGFMNALYGEDTSHMLKSCSALLLLGLGFAICAVLILRARRRRVGG